MPHKTQPLSLKTSKPYIGLTPVQFESRREEMKKGWEKFNPGEPYPEKMFEYIWLGMDRIDRLHDPRTVALEALKLDDGTTVYCDFSSDRTKADLYNLSGSKIAEWTNR